MTLASHRHTQFAHEIGESGLSRVGRNYLLEYLLFEMALEGIKTPRFDQFPIKKWKIWAFSGKQE